MSISVPTAVAVEQITTCCSLGPCYTAVIGVLSIALHFDAVPHSICASKLEKFEGLTVMWIRNWINNHTLRIAAYSSMPKWKPVMSDVFQNSVIEIILSSIFINYGESETDCTLW